MKFTPTPLAGAYLLAAQPIEDARGFFARTFCRDELGVHGLALDIVQSNLSSNRRRGTLRGLHYQAAPHQEIKLVSCPRGAIFDVIVDLRAGSPTWGRWFSAELSADNHQALYVPAGFAHGFQTLQDDTLVHYDMGERYHPDLARGVRWDDPALAIPWPLPDPLVSARDAAFGPLPDPDQAAGS